MIEFVRNIVDYLHGYFTGTVVEITNMFFAGNIPYIIIFVASLFIIIRNRNEFGRGHKLFAAYSLLMLLFVIYNPVWKYVFLKFPAAAGGSVFVRFWLLVPVWVMIAYACANSLGSSSKKLLKTAGAVMLAVVLIFSGNSIRSLAMMNDAGNPYKVNNAAVQIADEVLSLSGNEPVSLMIYSAGYGMDDNYVNGGTVYEGIRQYTGLIEVHRYYFYNDEWNAYYVSDMTPEGESTADYVNNLIAGHQYWNFDYVAMPDDERLNSKIDTERFPLAARAGGYCIYKL